MTALTRALLIAVLAAGLAGGAAPVRAEISAAPAAQTDWIVDAIYAAAARYGVSGDWLLSVAMCESNLDPNAVNPVTGDTGLFQFNPNTWAAWGGGDIWSVYDQADLAAWAFSQGLSGHWLCA